MVVAGESPSGGPAREVSSDDGAGEWMLDGAVEGRRPNGGGVLVLGDGDPPLGACCDGGV